MPRISKKEKSLKESSKTFQPLRGFKDILPVDQKYWEFIKNKVEEFAKKYGFKKIETPILEEASLFIRTIGKQTDIVTKEMFTFTDRSGINVCLRPEFTAAVVRAYINHGMTNLPQPVKLFYWGPAFRHERPQSGRQRQFYQFGLEVLGEINPIIDAQLIFLVYILYRRLGLKDISIQINSLGCKDCRKNYQENLINYYRSKRRFLCEECKRRLTKSPLRLLDCKESPCQSLKAEAPQIVDWLDEECKEHFMQVLEYLDDLEVVYTLNPYLVRGLDYYTKTVFEVWPTEEEGGSQNTLVGGGRYDDLVELIGGKPTPGIGFSAGIERTIFQLKQKERDKIIEVPELENPQVFLAQIGQQARLKALVLFKELLKQNILVAENFSKGSLRSQLDLANKLGVKYVLILGQKEVLDDTILIRDMKEGVQEIISQDKIVLELKKRLAKSENSNNSKEDSDNTT